MDMEEEYRTIKLPKEMIEAIENIREKRPQFGFRSNAEFIKHSVVEMILRINEKGNEK